MPDLTPLESILLRLLAQRDYTCKELALLTQKPIHEVAITLGLMVIYKRVTYTVLDNQVFLYSSPEKVAA